MNGKTITVKRWLLYRQRLITLLKLVILLSLNPIQQAYTQAIQYITIKTHLCKNYLKVFQRKLNFIVKSKVDDKALEVILRLLKNLFNS